MVILTVIDNVFIDCSASEAIIILIVNICPIVRRMLV